MCPRRSPRFRRSGLVQLFTNHDMVPACSILLSPVARGGFWQLQNYLHHILAPLCHCHSHTSLPLHNCAGRKAAVPAHAVQQCTSVIRTKQPTDPASMRFSWRRRPIRPLSSTSRAGRRGFLSAATRQLAESLLLGPPKGMERRCLDLTATQRIAQPRFFRVISRPLHARAGVAHPLGRSSSAFNVNRG